MPATYKDLLTRTEASIKGEEANRMKREAAGTDRASVDRRKAGNQPGKQPQPPQRPDDRGSVFDRISRERRGPPEHALTPLTAPRASVLAVMEKENLGQPAPAMRASQEDRNPALYCAYHRDIGHDTEDCYNLKREIEKLIKQGYLRQFVRNDQRGRPNNNRGCQPDRRDRPGGPPPPPPPSSSAEPSRGLAGVINTIAGGPTGGDS